MDDAATTGVLVTGASGFAGKHLCAQLGDAAHAFDGDVTDLASVAKAVRAIRPGAVVHLAARSSVAASWGSAGDVWRVNAIGTVNLLEAVRAEQPSARVLVVSTGEVYGDATERPTTEDAPVRPVSPYAASKAAAEIACGQVQRSGPLEVVVVRPFPHAGPGQDERFAIGSWTKQIARLEAAGGGALKVGDLSAERDITDVRDVTRAYRLLLSPTVAAATYNAASGRAVTMEEIVTLLVGMAHCRVVIEQEPTRLRRVDLPVLCGDASRLTAATGWRPEIPLEKTLADALDVAREAVRGEGQAPA